MLSSRLRLPRRPARSITRPDAIIDLTGLPADDAPAARRNTSPPRYFWPYLTARILFTVAKILQFKACESG
jgi:hypothetical protein